MSAVLVPQTIDNWNRLQSAATNCC